MNEDYRKQLKDRLGFKFPEDQSNAAESTNTENKENTSKSQNSFANTSSFAELQEKLLLRNQTAEFLKPPEIFTLAGTMNHSLDQLNSNV